MQQFHKVHAAFNGKVNVHVMLRFLQATALVTKQKCSLHIPYCCLTECIRDCDGEWTYGLHMDQEFLSNKQEKSDADKQREMWGLDNCSADKVGMQVPAQ